MRTKSQDVLRIHHKIAEVEVEPVGEVSPLLLKTLIKLALDSYVESQTLSAEVVHREVRERHGEEYQTPGYFLRLYRHRADLTQAQLAEKVNVKQHHLSEMENNKRPIGKKLAKQLAEVLDFDYRKLF